MHVHPSAMTDSPRWHCPQYRHVVLSCRVYVGFNRREVWAVLSTDVFVKLLLFIAFIAVAARLVGNVFQRFGQPVVVGEIALGVGLGMAVPHVPALQSDFSGDFVSYLTAFGNVGVILFMLVSGLEVDTQLLRRNCFRLGIVAGVSLLIPLLLGVVLAVLYLGPRSGVAGAGFALFVGVALAVTALPVLVRVVVEHRLQSTRVGQFAIGCAALNDVAAWLLLATAVVLSDSQQLGGGLTTLVAGPAVVIAILVLRPVLHRGCVSVVIQRSPLFAAMVGGLVCGAATEMVGLHFVFGAFLFGLIFPRNPGVAVVESARSLASIFLPIFFVLAGSQAAHFDGDWHMVVDLVLVLAVAVLGKLGGTYIAARLIRFNRRESGRMAALMNSRGVTELIAISVGVSTGILPAALYSVFVAMALITTAMTAPLLRLFGDVNASMPAKSHPVSPTLSP